MRDQRPDPANPRRHELAEHVREAVASLAAVEHASADRLRHAVDAREEVEMLIGGLVAQLRLDGASWTAIGAQLGVSKQAAQQRYGAAADQLLRETIRGAHRQGSLTPEPATDRPGAEPDPRFLLACDQVDGWALWRRSDDGAFGLLLAAPGVDEEATGAAQGWAAGVLGEAGWPVAGWRAVPGLYGGEYDDQGWGPVLANPTR